MKITVKWYVKDIFNGKKLPQITEFDTNDYFCDDNHWNEQSKQYKKLLIEELIDKEFNEKFDFDWKITKFGI